MALSSFQTTGARRLLSGLSRQSFPPTTLLAGADHVQVTDTSELHVMGMGFGKKKNQLPNRSKELMLIFSNGPTKGTQSVHVPACLV